MPFASHGLVEDIEYSWSLRVAGETIAFQSSSCVHGAMLGSAGAGAANQRRRWEFGRSEVRWRFLIPMLRSKRIGWWEKLISLVELTIPTMGTVLLLYLAITALDFLVFWKMPTAEGSVVRPDTLVFRALPLHVARSVHAVAFRRHEAPLEIRGDSGPIPGLYRLEIPCLTRREAQGVGPDGSGPAGKECNVTKRSRGRQELATPFDSVPSAIRGLTSSKPCHST